MTQNQKREFRQLHGRSPRFWQIWLEDDFVCSRWGIVVGDMYKEYGATKDRPGPKGKLGTKGYVDSVANAIFHMERAIRKKQEEGYVEVGPDGSPLPEGISGSVSGTISWNAPLPKNLCFSKPRNYTTGDIIGALESNNDLIFTRKVNGMSVIVQVTSSREPIIYSRRMELLTNHFPHLARAISELDVPPCSILLFEAFAGKGNSKQDLLRCSEIMRSRPKVAIEKQEKQGWMKFYLYRVPYWDAKHLEMYMTNGQWIGWIENTFSDPFIGYRDPAVKGQFLYPIEVFNGSVDAALEMAKQEGYEGWVCYQASAIIGAQSYSFDGKANRPACAFKLKLAQTDDFIAYWNPDKGTKERPQGTWGTGKNMGKVGTVSLYQLDKTGKEVYICDCSGFNDEIRNYLTGLKIWPICIEVKFEGRSYISQGDKSNALEFPRFQRIRYDKLPQDCMNELL